MARDQRIRMEKDTQVRQKGFTFTFNFVITFLQRNKNNIEESIDDAIEKRQGSCISGGSAAGSVGSREKSAKSPATRARALPPGTRARFRLKQDF